jgi:hypothetical protein
MNLPAAGPAERALEEAKAREWTVVSVMRDWATVFDPTSS